MIPEFENNPFFKIQRIKRQLEKTDYQSIRDTSKFARGLLNEEEKQEYFKNEDERQRLRDEIGKLEGN